jgi:feruloyl esterase
MRENPISEGLKPHVDFGANPGALRMLTYIPANLPAGAPLVVALHGCGQSAAAYCRGAGWITLADRLGFALLAPEQSSSNNFNGCFSWFQQGDAARGKGEAASIAQMTDRAITDYNLGRSRVFITGFSAGGGMAAVMLAAYPELFAGGAIIAGLAYGAALNMHEALGVMRKPPTHSAHAWGEFVREASTCVGPWPKVSVWQGDADRTVGAENAEAIISQWADVHGLAAPPTTEDEVDGYPHRVWRDPSGVAVVEAYTITGMDHGVPIAVDYGDGGCGAAGRFILDVGISSTEHIAAFWGLIAAAAPVRRLKPRPSPVLGSGPILALPKPRVRVAAASTARRAATDLQALIEGALTTAGVLKRR